MDKPDNMLTRQTTSHALVQDGKQCHKFTQIFFFLDRELGAVHVSVISFGLVRLSATNVLAVINTSIKLSSASDSTGENRYVTDDSAWPLDDMAVAF